MSFLTVQEAAAFLRLSTSTLYQKKDIPRHRLPNSRSIRFDEAELLAWAKGNDSGGPTLEIDVSELETAELAQSKLEVYHRNPHYR